VEIAVIGCGRISEKYLKHLAGFDHLKVAWCYDTEPSRSAQVSAEFGVPASGSLEDVLSDDAVELVLNLTPPVNHREVTSACFEAGKDVYTEKPMDVSREGAEASMGQARRSGLRFASAPCQFLGSTLQVARRLIDAGRIGEPTAAVGHMMNHGYERSNPLPWQYYRRDGGGPLFNRGPYYIGALAALLGPVSRVSGMGNVAEQERVIGIGPQAGSRLRPEVDTHVASTLTFESGAVASFVSSFDVWVTNAPALEIHGTGGTLALPDPTAFSAPLRLYDEREQSWETIEVGAGRRDGEAVGVLEMVDAMRAWVPHRASDELAYHVLDVILSVQQSSTLRAHVDVTSRIDRPDPYVSCEPTHTQR
jgi:predicted dehydrogenase